MKKLEQDADGTAVVTEEAGTDQDGKTVHSVWRCRPDQAAAHLATWNDTTRKVGRDDKGAVVPAVALSAGDVSAIRDAASEALKQRES